MARSVKKNFAFNSAYQVLNILVPLVTTPYLSRTIGSVGNGLFTYTQSITNYFVLFAALGMSNYGVRAIAECGNNREKRSHVFWNACAMNTLTGIVVFAVYLVYCFTLGAKNLTLSLLWCLWVVGQVIDVTWLLFGCQEFAVPTVRNFITRLLGMCFIFLFVHDVNDTWGYVFAVAAPFFINSILVWAFVHRYVDFEMPTWHEMLKHLKPCLLLFIPVIATSLYTLLDKVMLGAMTDMNQTGLYDYSEKISKMPMAIITALGAVVLPKMATVMATGKIEEGKKLVSATMWFMESCALALMFGIIAVAPEFVPVFFGPGYDECISLMSILSLIIPLVCATNVIGVQYMVPTHHDKEFTVSVLIGAVVNVAINLYALPRYGALGASIATVAAEFSVLAAQSIMVRGELDLIGSLRGAIPFLLMGLGMLVIIRLIASLFGTLGLPTAATLVVEACVGSMFYLIASLTWSKVTSNEYFKRLFPRFA